MMKLASSETRNAAAAASSSARPWRRRGVMSVEHLHHRLLLELLAAHRGVDHPGRDRTDARADRTEGHGLPDDQTLHAALRPRVGACRHPRLLAERGEVHGRRGRGERVVDRGVGGCVRRCALRCGGHRREAHDRGARRRQHGGARRQGALVATRSTSRIRRQSPIVGEMPAEWTTVRSVPIDAARAASRSTAA